MQPRPVSQIDHGLRRVVRPPAPSDDPEVVQDAGGGEEDELQEISSQETVTEELPLSLSLLAKERQAQRQAQAAPEVAPEHPERACEECGGEPIDYCPACEGFFCRACFKRLHCRGRRAEHPRLDISMAGFKMRSNVETMQSQVVNVQWHPFHDDHGIRYYYNFETHRSVRQLSRKELMWRPPPPLPT
eukprot:s5155_g6.t1